MAGFLWDDDNPFSSVRVKLEPFDDIDGAFEADPAIGGRLFNTPVKSESHWLNEKTEDTSFESGYISSSQDAFNQQGLSIDPDFVQEKPKLHCDRRVFAKIEHGGRLGGENSRQWFPKKSNSNEKFSNYTLDSDNFLFANVVVQ